MASETTKALPGRFAILKSPVITEKASLLGSTVVFRVDPRATKDRIKAAVEAVFGVKVRSVRTCRAMGKVKRVGRSVGRRDNSKKAYVALQPGEKLNLVEGV